MKESQLIFTNHPAEALQTLLTQADTRGGIVVIADSNTAPLIAAPLMSTTPALKDAILITIQAGDVNKTVATLTSVWQQMSNAGCTRHSLVVNVGGGVVTDLGGMAAATFKRGVPFINVPTTLLGAVDAATGGKTGVNLGNLKNEVGVFAPAMAVVLSTCWFATLPEGELLSGYGEMVKHGMLEGEAELGRLLEHDIKSDNPDALLKLLEESVNVKRRIVAADPTEQGIRRALNLGHTAGHAIETMMLDRSTPVAHGRAVAWGLLVTLIMSHLRLGLPSSLLYRYRDFLRDTFGTPAITCRDYPALIAYMGHDKKNAVSGEVAFTLLRRPGEPVIDCVVPSKEIEEALDLFQDLIK